MSRREFLKSPAAAAAPATAATTAVAETTAAAPESYPAPALASGVTELRLAIGWPDGVSGPADQARRLGQRIATMTGGRYQVEAGVAGAHGCEPVGGAGGAGDTHPSTT